jgi:predicted aspartyl protease
MRTRQFAALCALVLAGTACQVPLSPPPHTSAAEPGEVQFELAGTGGAALVVPVKVNGTGPYPFVLDTGATLTCVDQQLATELELREPVGRIGFGAGVGGSGQMRLVSIDSLQVGEAKTSSLIGCALDLQSIKGAGLDVRGLLGLNFLKEYRVTLDFTNRTLRLDTPEEQAATR